MQNQKYVAAGGKKNNRTVAEARTIERKLAIIGMPSLGIVAEGSDGSRVELEDFDTNEINPMEPANLLIRQSVGDGSKEENSVPDHGEYVNVAKMSELIAKAANALVAIANILGQFRPGITNDEVNNVIESMPGVAEAKKTAVLKAWESA